MQKHKEVYMVSKPKFNPKILRVKLNPEQAVLSCSCFDISAIPTGSHNSGELACAIGPAPANKYYTGACATTINGAAS